MNILLLSLVKEFNNKKDSNLYNDLLQELKKNGNNVYTVSPCERREHKKTYIMEEDNFKILKVKTGNIQKTNIIEKGISTILIESQFKSAIKKYFSNVKFDLVLYATPPITFCSVIEYIKKRDNAITYLMLKDIFPQNAVDIGMFSKKSLIYKYFRNKEKKLYKVSDLIGCMSEANCKYVIDNNPSVNKNIVHVLPNAIIPKIVELNKENELENFINEYKIPKKAKVFVYGGNLGKPQGIPFLIECLKANQNKEDRFFIICGKGTEYSKLEEYVNENKPQNVKIINGLPKDKYEDLLRFANIGMIFLDYRFTIPNFPSRILSYMEYSKPIISCTDPNTDIGDVIEHGKFGWRCYSNDVDGFSNKIDDICKLTDVEIKNIGENGNKYLKENYTSEKCVKIIKNKIKKLQSK